MKCQFIQESLITQDFNDISRNFSYNLPDKKPGFLVNINEDEKDFMLLVANPLLYSNSQRRIHIVTISRKTGSLIREFCVIKKIYTFHKESIAMDSENLKMISKEARSCFLRLIKPFPDNLDLDQIENLIQNQKQWKIAM